MIGKSVSPWRPTSAQLLSKAGAPIAGLEPIIQGDVPAVLYDPIRAALLQCATNVTLSPSGAWAGSKARPPGKDSIGLPNARATCFLNSRTRTSWSLLGQRTRQ
jgi:hypothetical protein